MHVPVLNIERILSLGGGVIIDGSAYPAFSLDRFAALAAQSGGTITLRGSSKLPQFTLERIAALGRSRVIFEF